MTTKISIIYFTGLLFISYLIAHPAYAYAQSTWAHTYGGSSFDFAQSIQQTSDGGYIVAGKTEYVGEEENIWILKLDSSGNIIWQKTYGGINLERATSIKRTSGSFPP